MAKDEKPNALSRLLDFLENYHSSQLQYRLHHALNSVMIQAIIPNQIWEFQFFDDGYFIVERFNSAGKLIETAAGEEALREFIAQFSE